MFKQLLSLSLALVGCGGIVNYSPDGGEGGSGALGGGGAGGNTTVNMTNAQSMDDVTTGPSSTCDLFCGQFGQCFDSQCFEICGSLYAPGCEAEADAFLQCLISVNPQDCAFDEGLCPAEEAAYGQCINDAPCFTEECAQSSDGSCECTGECFGTFVEQACSPALTGTSSSSVGSGGAPEPPQELFCNCFLGGEYVGDCFSFSCNLQDGCCQQYVNGLD